MPQYAPQSVYQYINYILQSFDNIVKSSEEDLSLCPGFGPQKVSEVQ